ncbi:MAG: hybrid sensor histidine kinase/response regulator [Verrucomicrobiae bacterium]|nr:hybrid sensor histidine kinase/response regulator [Verrucomicrobiae bacterium]
MATEVLNATPTSTLSSKPAPTTRAEASPLKAPRGVLLIVDDETGPRESLRIVFKDQYSVVTASCGRDGVKYAAGNPVDVAILDIRMPDMSGTDVLRELKLIDPRTEIIMLTGYETIDTARAAVRYGAADYLNKPFDVFKMRETVARGFEKRRLSVEAGHSLEELQNINKELEAEIFEKERKLSAGELSSGVVHEMNNPLAIISARAEMLSRELHKAGQVDHTTIEKIKKQLEFIQSEVIRCRKISQRFLNFFRAAGDAHEAVSLGTIIEDSLALIQAHPICKSTEIKYDPPRDNYMVRAHSADMIQLFINLGTNAVQAMNGEGSLAFSVETRPAASDWINAKTPDGCAENTFRSSKIRTDVPIVIISVKDTGPGIPANVIKKIFQPYFTTKEKGHGTGLGLAICTRFLDKYEGGMRFVSRVGEGTTVSVVLPQAAQ